MIRKYLLYLLTPSILLSPFFTSCKKVFEPDNYIAYFGGEIINPQSPFVLFMKDGKVLDTLFLDKKNRFYKKFDSLTPGLYTFKCEPEYQYIYFEKNDSLMIRLNAFDFDNSLAFCGRGEDKNNFLIDLYLRNDRDKDRLFEAIDYNLGDFEHLIDSSYNSKKAFYLKRRAQVGWGSGFDSVAKASLDFNHYMKKEIYPFAHQFKTGEQVYQNLPKNYYSYRKSLHYNNKDLTNFSPFIKYVSALLSNITFTKNGGKFNDDSLDNNILKLNIADTLVKDQRIKNVILNNIAYMYLLEDQNMYNNKKFIDRYLELSTDKEQQKEVREISEAVQKLVIGKHLPKVSLIDQQNKTVPVEELTQNKETVVFFWTTNAESHLKSSHGKIAELKKRFPNVNFVAININDSEENWRKALKGFQLDQINEYKSTDFSDIKKEWVITKVHRVIVLNPDGTIKNGFANLFDINFYKNLE